jgi:glycosyltransferase involved in cell wall biosynthesis
MKISFAATNPCHVYPFAVELAKCNALSTYYSGYPTWKLPDSASVPLRTHSLRTNIVYGLIKFVPERFRPSSRALYLWQDHGFDRWVGAHLEPCDFIHGLPGQCLQTFRAARRLGIRTVLNHATGPVREWVRIMEPEYTRVGLRLSDVCAYDDAYFRREEEEYALADCHCAASTVVRDQLVAQGIEPERVWLVPYGADTTIFQRNGTTAPEQFRIVFAGMLGLRKGLKTLLQALTLADRADWRMDFYGLVLGEARTDLNAYSGVTPLHFNGAVSQTELARAFRTASVLVLPSLEEGFGLVVPQALNCGCPVIVSDRVGAKDLVRHRENGSVIPVESAEALAQELLWHAERPRRTDDVWDWSPPAKLLLGKSESAGRSAVSDSARQ